MMTKDQKCMLLATAMLVALPGSLAYSATSSFDATASFLSTLSLINPVNMDVGDWYYGHDPIAGDTIGLGTDGSVTPSANFIAQVGSTPGAGSVDISGTATFPVEVRCSSSAILEAAVTVGKVISVTAIKVADGVGTPLGNAATGDLCNGLAGAAVIYNLVAGAATLKFGGTLDGSTASAPFVPEAFSTANGGGTAIDVAVIYQ